MNRPTHSELVRTLSKPGEAIINDLTPFKAELWHMGTGVASEGGEILDAIKKIAVYGKDFEAVRPNLVEELGDLRFFVKRIYQMCNITEEEVEQHNVSKLLQRYEGAIYSNKAAQERKDKLKCQHNWFVDSAGDETCRECFANRAAPGVS